ncbi:MAG: rhodanese-like domain-containing protein [Spirochaetes bacterium]|nr:rhodanese-like domain-containing protein [Spirochaetota bacterium]
MFLFSKKFLTLFFLLFLVFGANADKKSDDLVNEAKKEIKELSANDCSNLIKKTDVIIIDVREPDELKSGKILNSINIPRGVLEFEITVKAPDKSKTIVLYCKKDGRSSLAAQSLLKMGYKNVVSMKGGIVSWIASGLPIEK